MSRFVPALIVCALAAFADALVATQAARAQTPSPQAVVDARAACDTDIQKVCSGVQSGGGRILACLKQHQDEVADRCKQAVLRAIGRPGGGAGTGVVAPPAVATSAPAPVEHHDATP